MRACLQNGEKLVGGTEVINVGTRISSFFLILRIHIPFSTVMELCHSKYSNFCLILTHFSSIFVENKTPAAHAPPEIFFHSVHGCIIIMVFKRAEKFSSLNGEAFVRL